jgi:hypothetical protein
MYTKVQTYFGIIFCSSMSRLDLEQKPLLGMDFFTEYRGIAWSIGGEGQLNQTTTLPSKHPFYNIYISGRATNVGGGYKGVQNPPFFQTQNVGNFLEACLAIIIMVVLI